MVFRIFHHNGSIVTIPTRQNLQQLLHPVYKLLRDKLSMVVEALLSVLKNFLNLNQQMSIDNFWFFFFCNFRH